jgi:hypothetical protein
MKTHTARNAGLALVGLLALTIYILACTSFSPDDTKVLYPAFSGTNGVVGVALYDRERGRSELLFEPVAFEDDESEAATPVLLRPQWLADGRRILVAWLGQKEGKNLNLALIPWGARGPIKLFTLGKMEDGPAALITPLPVAGDRVFIVQTQQQVSRLDLKTGARTVHRLGDDKSEFSLYPAPGDKGVFYLEQRKEPEERCVFGRLDPDSFALTSLLTFTNKPEDGSFFTYDPRGQRVAFVESGPAGGAQLVVLERGKPALTRPLEIKGANLKFGNALFIQNGGALLASCQKKSADQARSSFGLLEIPLPDGPLRETTLIPSLEGKEEDMAALYFQVGVSHDGKTAAAASTYLACMDTDSFKPEDCALFFVDLSDAKRKVTRVPISLPAQRPSPAGK